MKKKLLIVLVVIIAAFVLLAVIGSSDDEEETADSTEVSETEEKEETESDDEEEDTKDASDSSQAESAAEEETEASDTTTGEVIFESQTVVDNDECSIVITGIDPDGTWGYTLDVELENKSEEMTYMFAIRDASVNGVGTDPLFAESVAAGKKSVEEICIYDSDTLIDYGIGDFTDICLSFYVYDEDDWLADYAAEETVHVYPYGEENAVIYVRESQDTDHVIYEDDHVSMTILNFETDDIWGYTARVYLINNTDKAATFTWDDVSVNGYMCDPYWAEEVPAGCTEFSTIYFYESELEEIGITDPENEIEEIEFVLSIYDSEDYEEDYAEETYTIYP